MVPWETRMFADPPPGRFCGAGARFGDIPPDLPKFSAFVTYLGWKGGYQHLVIPRPDA